MQQCNCKEIKCICSLQNFPRFESKAILPNSIPLYCDLCQRYSGDISMLQHFVTLPTFFTVELSSNRIDQIVFPVTMNLVGQNYVLKGMVRCLSHHFTVAITDNTKSCWVYIDDMCVSVRNYTCFSVLESCVYWTADTLHATVEYRIIFFNDRDH